MTVIRPNSISGVTSITAQGGNINVFRADGTAGDLTINNIVGAAATFTGVLSYEDVTNVDSVGVVTARAGINLVGNDLNVGSNIKIGNASGIVTATSFSGSGANLTSLPVPTTITVADESSDTTCNPLFVTTTSGNLAPKTGTNLVFNSATGRLGTGSLFLGTGSNESKTQDGLIMERNSGDGYVHITAGRTGGNYSGFNFYVAGGSGVTKRHSIDYQSNFRFYAADGTTERLRIDNDGQVTKPYQPSFTARSTGTWTHGSSTGYLDIDINMVEEFDVGGNYNGQIFTAPVTGKYFFSYTFQYQCTSGYLVVSLRKGVGGSYSGYGNMHMYPPQQSTKYHGPGIIGIMHLAAGNTVKPVAEVNYAGNQIQNANFSGYLLG